MQNKNCTVWLLLNDLYELKQASRTRHERLKAEEEVLEFFPFPRDYAVFRVGTRRNDDWAICTFWIDNETNIGSYH